MSGTGNNTNALEIIRILVWSGFYNAEEILLIVGEERFEPGVVDEGWARQAIGEMYAQKLIAERNWEGMTDCDKLDQAFESLNASDVIALHNAGNTQSDGLSDVTELYHELGGEHSDVIGYCFYHGQDLERAVKGEGLNLTFGEIKGTDETGVAIGKLIEQRLKDEGLNVKWNGSIGKGIEIGPLSWRRRRPAVV